MVRFAMEMSCENLFLLGSTENHCWRVFTSEIGRSPIGVENGAFELTYGDGRLRHWITTVSGPGKVLMGAPWISFKRISTETDNFSC